MRFFVVELSCVHSARPPHRSFPRTFAGLGHAAAVSCVLGEAEKPRAAYLRAAGSRSVRRRVARPRQIQDRARHGPYAVRSRPSLRAAYSVLCRGSRKRPFAPGRARFHLEGATHFEEPRLNRADGWPRAVAKGTARGIGVACGMWCR